MTALSILTSFSLAIISLALLLYKPPQWLICLLQRRYPDILFHIPTSSKILALTIDDGPSPYTSEINSVLTAHDAQATFFLIGSNISNRGEILKDLVTSGHELANHAMRDEPSVNLPAEELTRQIRAVDQHIAEVYNSVNVAPDRQPKYFRPGSGFFNSTVRRVVKGLGYKLVLGSVYPWDAQISWPRLNAWHVFGSVHPGAIVVTHERKWTAEMLRIVLPELKRQGWQVRTVTELLEHAEDPIQMKASRGDGKGR